MTDATQQPGATAPTNNFVGSATGQRLDGGGGGEATPSPSPAAAPAAPEPKPTPAAPAAPAAGRRPMTSDLPAEALADRLARERKAERERTLKELGIEDPDKHKAEREELARLRTEREKAERAKLSREQALQADLARERQQREAIEAQLREVQTSRVYERQESSIQSIAGRHVASNRYRYARADFIEYVGTLPKSQVAKLTERDIDRWFAKFAKDNPDFAATKPEPAAAAPAPEPAKPEPVKRPVNAAATKPAAAKPAPPPAPATPDPSTIDGKTFRPGQPNSMTKQEARQAMKRLGYRGW